MPNNTILNQGTGGDTILTVDLTAFSSYPTAGGKVPTSVLYVSQAPGSAPQPLSAANALPINGTVAVSGVSGTVAVSGPLTDAQLRATPVSVGAASLPLPAGAATSAKQAAPGTAGVPSSDVLTVQGVASMTALKVDGSASTQPISGTVGISGTVTTTANLAVGGSAVAPGNPVPVTQSAALPAGTNTIGGTISQIATGVVYSGSTALTPKFAPIAASASGDNALVAAVSGKRLRVLKYTVVAAGAVSVKFRSASASDLTGAMALAANSGIGGAFCPVGLFETAAGDPIVLNLSAAANVAGHLTYIEV